MTSLPSGESFELTEDHLKLIQRFYIDWDDSYYDGAPAVGFKRPYGNSDVLGDIYEILGWGERYDEETDEVDEELDAKALKIHQETATALQICCFTQSFEPGTYWQPMRYDQRTWVRV